MILPRTSLLYNSREVLGSQYHGIFHQYREYNSKHEVVFEIGYHHEKALGYRDVLHVHEHTVPGVEYHDKAKKYKISPGDAIYEKYKKLFKGVK